MRVICRAGKRPEITVIVKNLFYKDNSMSSRSLHSDHVFFLFISFCTLILYISVSLSHIVRTHVQDNCPTPFKIVLTYTSTSRVNAFRRPTSASGLLSISCYLVEYCFTKRYASDVVGSCGRISLELSSSADGA